MNRDRDISKARAALDWDAMTALALDPELVRQRRANHRNEKECAMCGALCAMRMMTADQFNCPKETARKDP